MIKHIVSGFMNVYIFTGMMMILAIHFLIYVKFDSAKHVEQQLYFHYTIFVTDGLGDNAAIFFIG